MGAYSEQSQSLKYVQKFGPQLEKAIAAALSWTGGRVIYHSAENLAYDLQVDCCSPTFSSPEAFVSVTYCKPDTPGHSNENKLQLKLGEMMLIKGAFPECRAILVIGGNRETWLKYVLTAFGFFFDRTIWAWADDFDKQVLDVRNDPKWSFLNICPPGSNCKKSGAELSFGAVRQLPPACGCQFGSRSQSWDAKEICLRA